jgi:hypothetical protein
MWVFKIETNTRKTIEIIQKIIKNYGIVKLSFMNRLHLNSFKKRVFTL